MVTLIGITLCLCILVGCVPVKEESTESNLSKQNVVDMHVHVAGVGAGESGCYVSDSLRRNWRYKSYLKAFGVSEKELVEEGDAIVFKKISDQIANSQQVSAAVVLALDGVVSPSGELDLSQTEVYIPNEFVQIESAKYPNLYFGASVNPYRRDAIERLEQVAKDGAVLIKWLPAIQQINPSDECLIPFYKKLVELNLPFLTHTGHEKSFSSTSENLGDPELLRLPLSLGVRVIAAHAATTGSSEGEDNMQRLLKMMPEYDNLYADISSLTQLNKQRYLPKLLANKEVHGRLIYGTDFPLINTPLVSSWHYLGRLSFREMIANSRMSNPWDRDVHLKQQLDVPTDVFGRSAKILGLTAQLQSH